MKYRLLKDLPNWKAGTVFVQENDDGSIRWVAASDSNVKHRYLDEMLNAPVPFREWFEPIKEPEDTHHNAMLGGKKRAYIDIRERIRNGATAEEIFKRSERSIKNLNKSLYTDATDLANEPPTPAQASPGEPEWE